MTEHPGTFEERLLEALEDYAQSITAVAQLLKIAKQRRDWEELGYDSWESYLQGEYRAKLLELAAGIFAGGPE